MAVRPAVHKASQASRAAAAAKAAAADVAGKAAEAAAKAAGELLLEEELAAQSAIKSKQRGAAKKRARSSANRCQIVLYVSTGSDS